MLTRKSLIQKTIHVAGSTLLSRILGVIREILTVRYLGASALSDIFFTAWKIPNSLRKIFAEGALSAVYVPAIVQTVRQEGKKQVGGLMTLGFIFFEGIVLFICIIVIVFAEFFLRVIGPGFSAEQIAHGAVFLRILMPFILLISSSALFAGALQATNHFFIPAFGPVLLNLFFIAGLIICYTYNLSIITLCWFIMLGGLAQLLAHGIAYFKYRFSFEPFSYYQIQKFGNVLLRFIPSLLSMSVLEIGLFIDTSFATLLSKGSVSLLYYANRFMGIPLGIFATAIATTLLPYFSRIRTYAPNRMGFYVLQATKLVWWITVPFALIMAFFAQKIFITLFVSDKFSIMQAQLAAHILVASLLGLFFFSINKVLLNVFYAFGQTTIPAFVAVFSMIINIMLNMIFIYWWQAVGLALATTIAAVTQTLLLYYLLIHTFHLRLYAANLIEFIARYALQIVLFSIPFFSAYVLIDAYFLHYHYDFFISNFGFWLWTIPLIAAYVCALYYTRALFGIRIALIERE